MITPAELQISAKLDAAAHTYSIEAALHLAHEARYQLPRDLNMTARATKRAVSAVQQRLYGDVVGKLRAMRENVAQVAFILAQDHSLQAPLRRFTRELNDLIEALEWNLYGPSVTKTNELST